MGESKESIKIIKRRREKLKSLSWSTTQTIPPPKLGSTNQDFQNKYMLSAYASFLLGYSYDSRQVSGKIPQIATCTLNKYVNNAFHLLCSMLKGAEFVNKNHILQSLFLFRGRILSFESQNRGKGFSALIKAPRKRKKHVPNLTEEIREGFF